MNIFESLADDDVRHSTETVWTVRQTLKSFLNSDSRPPDGGIKIAFTILHSFVGCYQHTFTVTWRYLNYAHQIMSGASFPFFNEKIIIIIIANVDWIEHNPDLLFNSPIIIPSVLAALCSRFILIKCLSESIEKVKNEISRRLPLLIDKHINFRTIFNAGWGGWLFAQQTINLPFVGVCSDSTSCMVSVFDDPEPLNSPLFDGPQFECRCISIALPCRIASCFSCLFASRNIAKYVNTIIVHGIQNEMELDTIE